MRQGLDPQLSSCSLSANSFAERIDWLRDLTSRALVAHTIRQHQAELHFQNNALKDIEELIRRESTCCSYFTFSIREEKKTILLFICWPIEKREAALHLLSTFLTL